MISKIATLTMFCMLFITVIAHADTNAPVLFKVDSIIQMKVDDQIIDINEDKFTIYSYSCHVKRNSFAGDNSKVSNYGITLFCNAKNSTAFATTAVCNMASPGDFGMNSIGFYNENDQGLTNILVACKTSYDRAVPLKVKVKTKET